MGCILEDKESSNINNLASGSPATGSRAGGGRRGSRVASLGGSRGSSRRGSTDLTELDQKPSSLDAGLDKTNTFSYWLQVTVVPSVSILCTVCQYDHMTRKYRYRWVFTFKENLSQTKKLSL